MDFKIGDDIDENGAVEHHLLSNNTKIIIIVIVALVAGLSVFLITNALFGKKEVPVEPPKITQEELSLTDNDVIESYRMLTFGVGGVRDKKFLSGINIEPNSFGNAEKYAFALQFAASQDLSLSDKKDPNGNAIYTIPENYMNIYMERVFGEDVQYSKDGEVTITFRFKKENKDTGKVAFNSNTGEFEVTFTELKEIPAKESFVDDVYYYLDKATSSSDGKLVLVEKVIYTKLIDNNGKSDLYLYSDAARTKSIGTINDISKENTAAESEEGVDGVEKYANIPTVFNLKDYSDKAGEITYNLKLGSRGYYFVSSEVGE